MVLLAFIQPLFAIDIGEIIVGLAALIIVIIRQLIEANRAAGKQAKPSGMPQPEPQLSQLDPVKASLPTGGQQADPLRAQVEEFLSRNNQRVEQKQPQPMPTTQGSSNEPPVRLAPPAETRSIGQPLQPAAWRQTPVSTAAPLPSAVPSERSGSQRSGKQRKRKSVAEHVDEQVSARAKDLARHASKLGRRIVEEDRQFDVQLKSKFDHQLGTLSSREATSSEAIAPAVLSPAAELAALLANPVGIRQAILINEILRRPTDRW